MRILVTGGSGVLGRVLVPLLEDQGHDVAHPSRQELNLFDAGAVRGAVEGAAAIYHLATRIPPPARMHEPGAWAENDRLRRDASRVLIDAALQADTRIFVQPTVAMGYPPGDVDESTPLADLPDFLRSALDAEAEAMRFATAGRTGVVLRLGLLYGPGTSTPRDARFGATLHVHDAGRALAAALTVASGIYNVVEDDNRVSNARFHSVTSWHPSS